MSNRYPDAEIGAQNLLENRLWQGRREGTGESLHTPPAQGHYPDIFYWDQVFADEINAQAAINGGPNGERWAHAAKNGLLSLIDGVQPDGFLPNLRFAEKTHAINPEKIIALGRHAISTNYTQPPVLAMGVHDTYEALRVYDQAEASEFLQNVYPRVRDHYDYFDRELSNSPTDKLSGVYHPHMTGRDSDPIFDDLKPHRFKRKGEQSSRMLDRLNMGIDYADILMHGIKLRRAGEGVEKWREVYWMNDVMMNCILVDNLHETSELAKKSLQFEDGNRFTAMATDLEQQILDKMWFPEARDGKGGFYNLDKSGEPISEISISNLFPLALPNVREEQLESVLDMIDDLFNEPYPLPTVATDSVNYDPHNREPERLWRGPTWINTNWYILERGIWLQIERDDLHHRGDLVNRLAQWAHRIKTQSRKLVDESGLAEHYDPITGAGQRKRVKNFAWSNLAYLMREVD
jgi:hypothetical protein